MKRPTVLFVIAVLFLSIFSIAPSSGAVPGSRCFKVGTTRIVDFKKYTCIKSGKKLVWNKGTPTSTATSSTQLGLEMKIGQNLKGWYWDGRLNKWVSPDQAPECEFPVIPDKSFVDFSKVQWLIAPGRLRNNNYKPHGALRWSTYPEPYVSGITVKLPFDATVIGAWSGQDDGDYQFGINAVSDCGIMIRIGHLFEPGPEMKKILDFIKPWEQTHQGEVFTIVRLKKGTIIATNVGQPTSTAQGAGSQMDFGLLDLRQLNPNKPISNDGSAASYYAGYSVCWLEGPWLSENDKKLISKIPINGGIAESDYCGK
jgi:hypothetical protein